MIKTIVMFITFMIISIIIEKLNQNKLKSTVKEDGSYIVKLPSMLKGMCLYSVGLGLIMFTKKRNKEVARFICAKELFLLHKMNE